MAEQSKKPAGQDLRAKLKPTEVFWAEHQKWLQTRGFILRRRYNPGWVPSWPGTKKDPYFFEDAQTRSKGHIMDATRVSDESLVLLKIIDKRKHPYEVDIGLFFSAEPLASDPSNHCVPIYEVLEIPGEENEVILVMPLLRKNDDPRFDTLGEVVAFFAQIFEGLQFMHKHHVAHRDCMELNIMMNATPLYPEPYHPIDTKMKFDFTGTAKHYTRTKRPVKYYLTDFGISRRYSSDNTAPLEEQILGGDKTVPEFQTSLAPCNPFPTDVYYLGNMVRQNFIKENLGFEFMEPLVADMVQDDPAKRPAMVDVVARFEILRKGLNSWKLRSRLVKRDDNSALGFFRSIAHWARRIRFIVTRVPPVPLP